MTNADAKFDDIKQRLDEIADLVSQEGIDLDEALSLYEEAVKLGVAACDVSEIDTDGEQGEGGASEAAADAPASASASGDAPVIEAAEVEVASVEDALIQEEEK